MKMLAGSISEVYFTRLSQACRRAFLKSSSESSVGTNADDIADIFHTTQGVLDLINAIGVSLDQVCLLDPKRERELSPDDTYTNFHLDGHIHYEHSF